MNVSFRDNSHNFHDKDLYENGSSFIWHDFDLEFEDAFNLIKQLEHHRNGIMVFNQSSNVCTDFYIFNNGLHVQIDGDGFWVAENITLNVAKEILRVTYKGCSDFGTHIPNTDHEWDAYTSTIDTRQEMQKL